MDSWDLQIPEEREDGRCGHLVWLASVPGLSFPTGPERVRSEGLGKANGVPIMAAAF